MNLPGKPAMLAIILLTLMINISMLAKLIERLKAYSAQEPSEEESGAAREYVVEVQRILETAEPNSLAAENRNQSPARKLAVCLINAARMYDVPPAVMVGILRVEGGHVGRQAGPNDDGSYDLGPMQINTQWLPELASVWRVDTYKAKVVLRDDGCMNVKVAAWILHTNIKRAGSVYGGIARYHSASPILGRRYAAKVEEAMEEKGLIRRN
jgi:hypothetical protein